MLSHSVSLKIASETFLFSEFPLILLRFFFFNSLLTLLLSEFSHTLSHSGSLLPYTSIVMSSQTPSLRIPPHLSSLRIPSHPPPLKIPLPFSFKIPSHSPSLTISSYLLSLKIPSHLSALKIPSHLSSFTVSSYSPLTIPSHSPLRISSHPPSLRFPLHSEFPHILILSEIPYPSLAQHSLS